MIFQAVTRLGLRAVAIFLLAGGVIAQEGAGPAVHKKWREVFVTVENRTMPVKGLEGHTIGIMEQRGFAFREGGRGGHGKCLAHVRKQGSKRELSRLCRSSIL
jgi:hypothetical protein